VVEGHPLDSAERVHEIAPHVTAGQFSQGCRDLVEGESIVDSECAHKPDPRSLDEPG